MAQSYKPRKGDEFHALFRKVWNVLERSSGAQTHSEKSVNVSDLKGVFGFALFFSWRFFWFFVSSCRKILVFSLLPIGRVLGFLLLPFGNVLGFSFLRFEEILVFFVSSFWRGSCFFCFFLVEGFFFLFLSCGGFWVFCLICLFLIPSFGVSCFVLFSLLEVSSVLSWENFFSHLKDWCSTPSDFNPPLPKVGPPPSPLPKMSVTIDLPQCQEQRRGGRGQKMSEGGSGR